MENNIVNGTERWVSLEEISTHLGVSKDTIVILKRKVMRKN